MLTTLYSDAQVSGNSWARQTQMPKSWVQAKIPSLFFRTRTSPSLGVELEKWNIQNTQNFVSFRVVFAKFLCDVLGRSGIVFSKGTHFIEFSILRYLEN